LTHLPISFTYFQKCSNGFETILQFVLIYFEQMGHTLRPDGQARPALSQDTEKATKWTIGPETRLCDQIASRNLHGNPLASTKLFWGQGGAADLAEQKTWVELRPNGQAGPALGQDTEKATKWAAGPKTRLCDQITSQNLHGNFTGCYKVFPKPSKGSACGGRMTGLN